MELELALARKGRQAAEANSEQLREKNQQLLERANEQLLERANEQLLERANWWKTVVAAVTVLGAAAGVVFGVLDLWQKRPKTIANNAAIIANNAAIELANNAAIKQV